MHIGVATLCGIYFERGDSYCKHWVMALVAKYSTVVYCNRGGLIKSMVISAGPPTPSTRLCTHNVDMLLEMHPLLTCFDSVP